MYGPFDYDDLDFEPIDEIARMDGFSIDDDGHWVPLEDNPLLDEIGYEPDRGDYPDFD